VGSTVVSVVADTVELGEGSLSARSSSSSSSRCISKRRKGVWKVGLADRLEIDALEEVYPDEAEETAAADVETDDADAAT
jgi:hypothetical protein